MMYILSGKNGRFNSSSRTLFGDRAKRVYVLLVYCRSPTGECRRQLVWCPKARNDREGADQRPQRDIFIFDRTRLYLFARILTGRSLPRDRHACRHATPPAPFLRLGVRLAPARGIHGAASGGVVAAPSLASGLARPYSERFLRVNKHL